MKNKSKKTLNTLLVGGSILVASAIPQIANGQQQGFPPSVINPFLSPDTTETAKAYNANNGLSLEDIAARNNLIDARIKASRVHTIPANNNPLWNCNQWSQLQIVNAYDFGDNVYDYQWNKLLYNGYKGFVLADIYANGGTLADEGKDGLPLFIVNMTDPVTLPDGHAMIVAFPGNNILKQLDRNNIEPRDGITKVQSGQLNIPMNCERFVIGLPYVAKSSLHEKDLGYFRILEFKIVNGEMILTYNINDDPIFNNRIHVITERENDKPKLNIASSTNPNKLKATATDANLRDIIYRVDGGTAKPLTSGIEADMELTPGNHTIVVTARDYFRLVTDTILQRIITTPTNYAPTVTIFTPEKGKLYEKNVNLKVTTRDTENDPTTTTYSLDNGTPITINQDYEGPLSLADGIHKIVITASDATHTGKDATKDSTIFEFKKATGIEDPPTLEEKTKGGPNPVKDKYHIFYKSNLSNNAYMTLTTFDGKPILRQKINGATEEYLDMTKDKPGMYFLRIIDGKNIETIKLIKDPY